MRAPVKTQVENGLSMIFYFQGHTIDMSDQAIFTLKDLGLNDEKGNEINIRNPLTATQRQSGNFVLSMMIVHPYQSDPN